MLMEYFTTVIQIRSAYVLLLLALAVLLIPGVIIPHWYHMINEIKSNLDSSYDQCELVYEIEDKVKLMSPMVNSANNLARFLASNIDEDYLSFALIQSKVAPTLFEALSTIPYLAQISYIALNGLFFSYYKDGTHTFAVYSNTTFLSNSSTGSPTYTWYTQLVNLDSGILYGQPGISRPLTATNFSWFQGSLSSKDGCTSLGFRWDNANEQLLLNTVSVNATRSAISLGFPMKAVEDFFSYMESYGTSLYLATQDGEVILEGLPKMSFGFDGNYTKASVGMVDPETSMRALHIGDMQCKVENGAPIRASSLELGGKKFKFYCSQVDLVGIKSVYVLAVPYKEFEDMIHETSKNALWLVIVMMTALAFSMFSFLSIVVKAESREIHLCSKLIKQMEATQQAERKSMKKSLAFASASHDVRAALAGVTGLVELSRAEVKPGSELDTNMRLIDNCANDLLELLNSILDMSKIEAGKMQLQEEEFNLFQLLEDVADLYHPVGMKKGVEVVLDHCDESVSRIPLVRGDRGKLKQILCNLLSNAVKFTSEGHISIRAWAQKPSMESSIIASKRNAGSLTQWILHLFSKNRHEYDDLEEMRTIKQDPRCIEFTVEVDDTGIGIPKEKRKSVFENYVQVKETIFGVGGTGLGLGIVQSLVRLMGGEIEILDKEHGKRGTCFSFNVFLLVCDDNSASRSAEISKREHAIESDYPHAIPGDASSLVVLLIQNNERRKMVQTFMGRHGIRPIVLKKESDLPGTLKKIKHNLISASIESSSGLSERSPRSCLSSGASSSVPKNLPLSALDGIDDFASAKLGRLRGSISCVLILIDTGAGEFTELCRSVAEFRRDLYSNSSTCCKVVWLEKPDTRVLHFRGLNEESLAETDHVMTKPLHGSRLYQVIGLLPEFRGKLGGGCYSMWSWKNNLQTRSSNYPVPEASMGDEKVKATRNTPDGVRVKVHGEIEEICSSSSDTPLERRRRRRRHSATKKASPKVPDCPSSSSEDSLPIRRHERQIIRQTGLAEEGIPRSSDVRSLQGKRVLIAEDNNVLRMLAKATVSQLGASVVDCPHGNAALKLVCEGLKQQVADQRAEPPYDCILMDCEMPEMDGYEATRRIREEEKRYGVRIPIVALTAHSAEEQGARMIEAGMDCQLTKPLNVEKLLKAVAHVRGG